MSTSKVSVVDDDIDEFDFSRAIPSPFRAMAREGMRFHIVADGADFPTYHVIANRRGRSWWIEIVEIDGSGQPARWATIELTAREAIAQSLGIDPSDVNLVIGLPAPG